MTVDLDRARRLLSGLPGVYKVDAVSGNPEEVAVHVESTATRRTVSSRLAEMGLEYRRLSGGQMDPRTTLVYGTAGPTEPGDVLGGM